MNKRLLELHDAARTPAATSTTSDAHDARASGDVPKPAHLTPSEVLERARLNVEHMGRHGELRVVGEVSGIKTTSQGHWTFELKDKRGALSCIVFYNDTRRVTLALGGPLAHGMHVVTSGLPTVSFGRVQLKVKSVEHEGEGDLDKAFRALKAKLEGEGLFAPERKRPLPRLPSCVGVVTSPTGAALRDTLKILYARAPRLRVIVAPTKVQGKEASAEIADAVRKLDKLAQCDVILVVRGGGSLEDLWCFNTEPVARAIASCRAPVISGVGHETDTTIADFVADARAATPSNAAEMAVPVVAELEVRLDSYRRRLAGAVRPLVDRRRAVVVDREKRMERALRKRRDVDAQRLKALEARVRARAPDRVLAERRAKVVELEKRLERALQKRRDEVAVHRRRLVALEGRLEPAMAKTRARLGSAFEVLVARLESISPLTVLSRGYAIARRKGDGHVVRAPSDAPAGTQLTLRVDGGELDVTVDPARHDADDA